MCSLEEKTLRRKGRELKTLSADFKGCLYRTLLSLREPGNIRIFRERDFLSVEERG